MAIVVFGDLGEAGRLGVLLSHDALIGASDDLFLIALDGSESTIKEACPVVPESELSGGEVAFVRSDSILLQSSHPWHKAQGLTSSAMYRPALGSDTADNLRTGFSTLYLPADSITQSFLRSLTRLEPKPKVVHSLSFGSFTRPPIHETVYLLVTDSEEIYHQTTSEDKCSYARMGSFPHKD